MWGDGQAVLQTTRNAKRIPKSSQKEGPLASLKTSEKSRNQGWVLKRRQDLETWVKEESLPLRKDVGGATGKGTGYCRMSDARNRLVNLI